MDTRHVHHSFNPRARVGRDNMGAASRNAAVFQSTRPRGARRWLRQWPMLRTSFNPRARVGRDAYRGRKQGEQPVFQSTRPRGARHNSLLRVLRGQVSIHAPAWGAT